MLMQHKCSFTFGNAMRSFLRGTHVNFLTIERSVPGPGHLPRQVGLHGGPLAGDDAVDVSVAQRSVRSNLMASQDAVELCAKTLNSSTALMIEGVRSEFDRNAVERFECVGQEKELALGVESRALDALAVPGRSDLDTPIDRVDVHIGGHSDRTTDRIVDDRERQHQAVRSDSQIPQDAGGQSPDIGDAHRPQAGADR